MIDNIFCARATMLNTKLVRNYPHYSNQKKVAVIYLPFYTIELPCQTRVVFGLPRLQPQLLSSTSHSTLSWFAVPNPSGFWSSFGFWSSKTSATVAVIHLPFHTLLICRAKAEWLLVFQDFSHRSRRPLSWDVSLHTSKPKINHQ